MARFSGVTRFRFRGNPELAKAFIPEARKHVGALLEGLQLGGISSGARKITNPSGVVFRTLVHAGSPVVEIDVRNVGGGTRVVPIVWAAGSTGEKVYALNTYTGRVEAQIDCGVDSFPQFVVPRGNSEVWAGCQVNPLSQIKIINANSFEVMDTITVDGTNVGNMAFSADGSRLYVAVLSGIAINLECYDVPTRGKLWDSFVANMGNVPFGVAVTQDGEVLVGNASTSTASPYTIAHRLDAATGAYLGTINGPPGLPTYYATQIVVTPDGRRAVVAALGFRAFVVDLSDFSVDVILRDTVAHPGSMISATYAAADPNNSSRVYLSSRDSVTVDVLDLDALTHAGSTRIYDDGALKLPSATLIRGIACFGELSTLFVARQGHRTIAALQMGQSPPILGEFTTKDVDGNPEPLLDGEPWGLCLTSRRMPA